MTSTILTAASIQTGLVEPALPSGFNLTNIYGAVLAIGCLILALVGLGVMWSAKKPNASMQQAGKSAGVSFIGGAMVVIAITGGLFALTVTIVDFGTGSSAAPAVSPQQ